jgi:CRP/FNR family transcriptional regulator, cyclic AMP receptor protein
MSDGLVGFSFLTESTEAEIPVWLLKAGETIFNQGDPATELYVIQSGRVGIHLGNRLLDTLEANEMFGEMAMVDPAPRSATAIATTDVRLVRLSKKQFLELIRRSPTFALDVMGVLARRLRAANKAI